MCRLPRRPAVSTTVRWPALTPLKRKGNQHFTVDHSYSAVLKQKCVNLWKLIPQGGWSQMDPQRSSLLLGWQTPPTTAATQLGEDDLRDALCSKPKTWNLIFLLSSQRLTVSGRLSSCGRVHSSVPPPVSLAPTRLHSLHLPPAPWTLKTSSPPVPTRHSGHRPPVSSWRNFNLHHIVDLFQSSTSVPVSPASVDFQLSPLADWRFISTIMSLCGSTPLPSNSAERTRHQCHRDIMK